MSSSDSDEDNAIRYGTPLEPYEEDEIPSKRKYQEPTDQYAVDAHGRRRFHGAFTGGFSAGFGNTVGSQEGWTPSTFKSSRSEKAQSASQRPEDFMDDEDCSEFGIAPKHMQTNSEFSGQKRARQTFHDGPIPGEPVLGQLIRAVHETAAVKMLRAMGWKPGQGTGDRVTRREKKVAKQQQKVYGCYMPENLKQPNVPQTEDSDHSSDSEFEFDTLFAPDDYEPYLLSRKSDRFGLGYQGLSRHSVLGSMVGEYGESSSTSHLKMKDKGKKVSIRGQAFGVGAFEADDEDVYAKEDMSHYDFAIGGPPTVTAKKKTKEQGSNVLEGFVRATKPMPPVAVYPPPALPRDYTPAAAGARRTRFDNTDQKPRDQGLGRHELTAAARGALLGEEPETPPQQATKTNAKEDLLAKVIGRNVNFVSTNTTDNVDLTKDENSTIETVTSINNSLTALNNKMPEKIIDLTKPTTSTPDFISIKDSGKELTNVFKPFASNPAKQTRYENYLKDKDSLLERDSETDRLCEWERERENMEFEQAAKLYRPLTGVMGDRFTHASEPDDSTNPLTAVSKSKSNYGIATPEQIAAAENGVYGVMTRTKTAWRPESIVCKRFNVPEPGGVRSESKKEDKPKISYSIFSYLESSVHDKDSFAKEQSKFSGSKSQRDIPKTDEKHVQNPIVNKFDSIVNKIDKNVNETDRSVASGLLNIDYKEGTVKRMTTAELFLKESEKTKEKGLEVTETIDKFDKMDLYKSIFLSDSEEEINEDVPGNKNDGLNLINDFMETSKNVQRNTSPPRGIFANIDFDELNSWRRNVDKADSIQEKPTTDNKSCSGTDKSKEIEESMNVDEVYGPKIPEVIQKRLQSNDFVENKGESSNSKPESTKNNEVQEINSSSPDSWVEAKEVKKKKSKHKKKKSKHKKSKHKKKKDR